MMGVEQERWFYDGLIRSRARWNIIAQQVMMAKVDRRAGPEQAYSMDQWSGYEAARNRVLQFLHEHKPSNPVVITGDIHSNWVADLKLDFADPKSPTVGTEFVGTSITSGGNGADSQPAVEAYLPENPHVHFYNNQRGYVRCVMTRDKWQSDYRVLPFVEQSGADDQNTSEFRGGERTSRERNEYDDLRYPIGRFQRPEMVSESDRQDRHRRDRRPARRRCAPPYQAGMPSSSIRRTGPDGWTVRQLLHHVPESHMNSYIRFKLALTEDEPTIKPYDEDAWAHLPDATTAPVDLSLNLLDTLHQRWVLSTSVDDAPSNGTVRSGTLKSAWFDWT